MQEVQVQSLVRELDPECCNLGIHMPKLNSNLRVEFTCHNYDLAQPK